jgi:hypothetical protein
MTCIVVSLKFLELAYTVNYYTKKNVFTIMREMGEVGISAYIIRFP